MTAVDFDNSLLAQLVENPGLVIESTEEGSVGLRTAVRALPGMQKEALLVSTGRDRAWRMLCDEGPYLNGTDLAPPPLAYFSAGMASLIADAIESFGIKSGNPLRSMEIVQDNRYTMEGSALRGTMTGGALPVEIELKAETASGRLPGSDELLAIVCKTSIGLLMSERLVDTFSLMHNQSRQAPGALSASVNDAPPEPLQLFDRIASLQTKVPDGPVIVSKLDSTETVFDADHGAGAAMKSEQKRELHIRSVLTLRSDGLRDIRVQILKPIGSVFGFVADPSTESNRAPNGFELVSAGIAFCFMTQIGRFATITKKSIDHYSVVQDTRFDLQDSGCEPVDTHVYIDSPESLEDVQHLITKSEQTCFLHAACRESNPTRLLDPR